MKQLNLTMEEWGLGEMEQWKNMLYWTKTNIFTGFIWSSILSFTECGKGGGGKYSEEEARDKEIELTA